MGWGKAVGASQETVLGDKREDRGVVSMTVNVSTKEAEFKHSSVATSVRFSVHRLSSHTESTVVVYDTTPQPSSAAGTSSGHGATQDKVPVREVALNTGATVSSTAMCCTTRVSLPAASVA